MNPKNKGAKTPPRRLRLPTNITLDPVLKEEAKRFAASEATDLTGLVNALLVERLRAAGMWPPKRQSRD